MPITTGWSPRRVEVARHPRAFASHRVITDPGHARAAAALRGAHRQAMARTPDQVEVEVRDLAIYDRTLGVA